LGRSSVYLNLGQIISVCVSPSKHQVIIETTTRIEQYRLMALDGDDAPAFLRKWDTLAKEGK